MYSEKVILKNATGLHARPGSNFAMKALNFKSSIFVSRSTEPEKKFNGKSLMKLLALGINQGEEIVIEANGEDEKEAVKSLVEFIHSGCGEE